MLKRGLFLCVCLAACAVSPSAEPERTSAASSAIVKGKDSDASQDGVVLVMHYDAVAKGGGAASGCTGSLLTPRLLLTARHCVAITDSSAACDSEGKPVAGGQVTGDHVPSAIYVFGGKDRPDFLSGNVRPSKGQEILTTGAKTLCNNDIALVLLDRPLEGAKIVPIRLDAGPKKSEKVTVVGWGIADDSPNPPTRRQKTDVEVLDVGPAEQLGKAEFRVGEGTCQGDSGGPAIAASGAVLGALSRGGNGTPSIGADACLGGTNIFSSVVGHADFIRAGYDKAGQEPWIEGAPNPLLAKMGGVCAVDADCVSNLCIADQPIKTCSQDCAVAACPDGFTCGDQSGKRVCLVDKETRSEEGCAIAAAQPQPRLSRLSSYATTPAILLIALTLFFVRVRRKK
jgi:hypothetical protein